MFNYDYETAYQNGNLSDFLYEKAKIQDRDGVSGLNRVEYSLFQQWIEKEDVEKYGLEEIDVSFTEKWSYYGSKSLPEHIKNSYFVTDKQKKTLKTLNRLTAGFTGLALLGSCLTAIGGMTGRPTLVGGVGFKSTIASFIAIGGFGLTSFIYKKCLERNINKAEIETLQAKMG